MYYFNLVPRMGLAESLSLYHQTPNLVQIRKSEIHNVVMNFKILKQIRQSEKFFFKILKNYIYIKKV